MSTLAKIFVVINLFLALAFLGVSAAFLAEKDNWKIKFENVADQLASERTALTARATRLENEKNDQIRAYNILHERHVEVLREWENTRNDNKSLTERQAELETRLSSLSESYKDIDEQIQREREENSRLTAGIRKSDGERDDAREAQREAEEAYWRILSELEEAENRLRSLGEEIATKDRKIEDTQVENAWLREKPTGLDRNPVAPPPIDGRITAVSADVPLVMLSVGRDDLVQAGHVFTVYRGDTYVAKVRVKEVFQDSCSALIIPAYKKYAPREGDNVSTRIY